MTKNDKICTVCSKLHARAGKTCSTECMKKAQASRVVPDRFCTVCEKSFSPSGPRSKKCAECSQKKCTVCYSLVPKTRTGVTCSPECAYRARAKASDKVYSCAVPHCSNSFKPHNPQQKWCLEQHSKKCSKCEIIFDFNSTAKPPANCPACRKKDGDEARNAGRKKHYQDNFDVDSNFHRLEIQEKVKESNMEKYGVENQFQREKIIEQIKQDALEKHGVEWHAQRDDVKEKIKESNIDRYGVPVPAKNDIVKAKMKKTTLERYGAENPSQIEEVKKKKIETSIKKYGVKHPMQSESVQKEYSKNFKEKHGVDWPIMLPNAVPGRISKPNERWRQRLEEATGVKFSFEEHFSKIGSLDLYAEANGVKLAVEISPTATHNSFQHKIACNRRGCSIFPCIDHGKQKKYHQYKTIALRELYDVDLITIFDWTDEEKIINFIKAKLKLQKNKIGARQCELKRISQKEANIFLKKHHILGASQKQTYCYGLFYKDELLQVQTFAQLKNGDWEAKRLASHPDWVIMGGVSRGTKAFIREAAPGKIVAFASLDLGIPDFDKNFNNFREREVQSPVKCWSKGKRIILAKSAAFQSADRLLGIASNSKESKYPEDWSNDEVFIAEGWLPVWDCGKIKESWIPSSL